MENNLFRCVQFPPGVHACDRCKAGYVITGMSFFDEEWCCLPCLEDEKLLPDYTAAREAEKREVALGNQRYAGIGLAEEDRDVLGVRLKARRPGATHDQRASGSESRSLTLLVPGKRRIGGEEAEETPDSDAA